MKHNYSFFLGFILLMVLVGCQGFRELPVEYDYSYNGKFKKYSTFDLMETSIIDEDSSMFHPIIESNIISRMKFLGYRQTNRKPNLLIAYRLFNDSLAFKGYEQPEIEDWVEKPYSERDYHAKNINMKTGTLLIQLYDRKQEKLIWNGYSTTLYGSIEFQNQRQLRNAVISILDKYRFFADGYLEGKVVPEELE